MNRSTTATWVRLMAGTAVLGLSLVACGSDSGSDAKDKSASDSRRPPSESASAPADTFTNDKCKADQTSADAFRVGGILPLTGNLAFLGPPEIAGVGLAVSDINAAGGVNGAKACHDIQDSGDSTDMSVSTASAGTLVAGKPSVVIGAASSSVSLNVVDTFADNKIIEVSPANTAVDLSGYSPCYFRTAPPDTHPGQRARHADLHGRLPEDRLPGVQRHLRHRPAQRGPGDRRGRRRRVRLRLQGRRRRVPGRPDHVLRRGQAARSPPSPTRSSILAFDETKAIVPELKAPGLGHVEDLLLRRQHRGLQQGLRRRAPSRAPRAPSPAPTPRRSSRPA